MKIKPTSQTGESYSKEIRSCKTLRRLRYTTKKYGDLTQDAYEAATHMTEPDFIRFVGGLRKEEKGIFPGDKWVEEFGMILLPARILKVELVAFQFKVPFGCAYHRIIDLNPEMLK
jgi:hypothetical protein